MAQTEANKKRASARYRRQKEDIDRLAGSLYRCFEMASEYLWTCEQIWDYRRSTLFENPLYQKLPYAEKRYLDGVYDYQKLPYAEKRYLDGVYDTLEKAFEKANYVWTHVLDGVRFDAFADPRKGREREINTDLSHFCYKRKLEGEVVFIPIREEAREKEFQRNNKLPGKMARLLPVSATRTALLQKYGLI